MKTEIIKIVLLSCIIIVLFTGCEISNNPDRDDYKSYINLEGEWKFSIGDDLGWASQRYYDNSWSDIEVPSSWENEGYHGYNGYAWYRRYFEVPEDFDGRNLYLHLGYIDDVDEVYINGVLVGSSGSFPPGFETAYNAFRLYVIPGKIFKANENNLIAVRVYDSQQAGGIVSGDIGFYINKSEINPEFDLTGKWKFHTGDNIEWKNINVDDHNWDSLFVPSHWDNQGYRDYNGFAWYRKTIDLPLALQNKKLILLMGKIDDIDEVYINGILIGSTGVMKEDTTQMQFSQEYQSYRGYYIPDNIIKSGSNIIAVRVYDGYMDGGIYEGPVGLTTQEKYSQYWKDRKEERGFFE